MRKNAILILGLAALAGVLAWQQSQLRTLRAQLAQQKVEVDVVAPAEVSSLDAPREVRPDLGPMRKRIASLEEQVRQLTLASEALMERGQIPLSAAKTAELKKNFSDASLPTAERLRILRILQQHRAIDDEVVTAGLAWVDTLTDPRMITNVLESFARLKNPALRDKALQLLAHTHEHIRERAARLLGSFEDAQVEAALEAALASEQDRGVREQLQEALRELPMNAVRQAKLEGRVLDTGVSVPERLAAFQSLMSAKVADAKTVATFANEVVAQNNTDVTARLFRMLDNTGNLAAAPALIQGLQLEDSRLRGSAVDALSEMQSDPNVVKWLQHVAKNDADERVRAEASRVLSNGR